MPNWCYTSYVIEGDKKEVKDLYCKLNGLLEMETSLLENGFGNGWLGNVVQTFGGDPKKISCRGCFDNLEIEEDASFLCFNTETAWSDKPEVWDLVLSRYETLKCYFRAEECGVAYYATSDSEGKHFPERYITETSLNGIMLFEDEVEVFKYFEEITSISVSGMEEMEEQARNFNSMDEDKFFYIHQFEIINTNEDETVKSFLSQQPSHKFQN